MPDSDANILSIASGVTQGGDQNRIASQELPSRVETEDANKLTEFPAVPSDETGLWDPDFLRALKRLKALCDFLSQTSVTPSPAVRQAALLGGLNQLRFAVSGKGRFATYDEWSQVEQRTQIVWAALPEPLRRKFLTTQAPTWLSWVMSFFVVISAISLVVAFIVHTPKPNVVAWTPPGNNLIPFLVWIMSLGAIGGASSIGLNALSVQDDASFDISNGRLICLRLIIGALFGTVLSLPFGFGPFYSFLDGLANTKGEIDAAIAAKQAAFLLMPFVLGFSTSVVILVLNRLIEAVQTFFGKASDKIIARP